MFSEMCCQRRIKCDLACPGSNCVPPKLSVAVSPAFPQLIKACFLHSAVFFHIVIYLFPVGNLYDHALFIEKWMWLC